MVLPPPLPLTGRRARKWENFFARWKGLRILTYSFLRQSNSLTRINIVEFFFLFYQVVHTAFSRIDETRVQNYLFCPTRFSTPHFATYLNLRTCNVRNSRVKFTLEKKILRVAFFLPWCSPRTSCTHKRKKKKDTLSLSPFSPFHSYSPHLVNKAFETTPVLDPPPDQSARVSIWMQQQRYQDFSSYLRRKKGKEANAACTQVHMVMSHWVCLWSDTVCFTRKRRQA